MAGTVRPDGDGVSRGIAGHELRRMVGKSAALELPGRWLHRPERAGRPGVAGLDVLLTDGRAFKDAKHFYANLYRNSRKGGIKCVRPQFKLGIVRLQGRLETR